MNRSHRPPNWGKAGSVRARLMIAAGKENSNLSGFTQGGFDNRIMNPITFLPELLKLRGDVRQQVFLFGFDQNARRADGLKAVNIAGDFARLALVNQHQRRLLLARQADDRRFADSLKCYSLDDLPGGRRRSSRRSAFSNCSTSFSRSSFSRSARCSKLWAVWFKAC